MLYIFGVDKEGNTIGKSLHVGPETPSICQTIADNMDNHHLSVQADGDELAHILEGLRFLNIPRTTKRVQRWYGDHARFILGNW